MLFLIGAAALVVGGLAVYLHQSSATQATIAAAVAKAVADAKAVVSKV